MLLDERMEDDIRLEEERLEGTVEDDVDLLVTAEEVL